MSRPAIPAAIKREVYERDGGKCVQCRSTQGLQYEHEIPYALVRTHDVANIRLMCSAKECHRAKTAKDAWRIAKTERQRKKAAGEPVGRKQKPQIPSRPFDRTYRRKLDGTTVKREDR